MYNLVSTVLLENDQLNQLVQYYQSKIDQCAEWCRTRTKNDKNYLSKVSVCTSICKAKNLNELSMKLQRLKSLQPNNTLIDSKIINVKLRLEKEMLKMNKFKSNLKRRQTKIPVDLSLKPSPERYDPRKIK